MNKRLFLTACLAFLFARSEAQFYYYKDILTNKELLAEMNLLKENKVRTVKVTSFDKEDEPSEGFFCEKKLRKDYTEFETITRSYASAPSELTSYFSKKGLLEKTIDSSEIFVNSSFYTYNDHDQLTTVTITSVSKDDDLSNDAKEEHLYQYDDKGILNKMILVKNGTDSSAFVFTADEKGNIIEEKGTRTGKSYYYYYNAKNKLTDVVYFNTSLRKLLPILMFEYNSSGQATQMVTAEEGSVFYYTWKYTYDNGLKSGERCYMTHQKEQGIRDPYHSSSKELMGIIQYEYK